MIIIFSQSQALSPWQCYRQRDSDRFLLAWIRRETRLLSLRMLNTSLDCNHQITAWPSYIAYSCRYSCIGPIIPSRALIYLVFSFLFNSYIFYIRRLLRRIASTKIHHHHHHLFLKRPFLPRSAEVRSFFPMRPLHISLNTTHAECKPSSSISSLTHSLQVFLSLLTHLTPATTTFQQADTQSSPLLRSTSPNHLNLCATIFIINFKRM